MASRHRAGWFHVVRDPEQGELVAAALLNEPSPPYTVVYADATWRDAKQLKERLECSTSTERTG